MARVHAAGPVGAMGAGEEVAHRERQRRHHRREPALGGAGAAPQRQRARIAAGKDRVEPARHLRVDFEMHRADAVGP